MGPEDFTAQIDQGRAGAADVARIFAGFYLSLVREGVPEEAASEMSVAYVEATMANHKRRTND